jgi:hypothetical protein
MTDRRHIRRADLLRGIKEVARYGETDVTLGRRVGTICLDKPEKNVTLDQARRKLVFNTNPTVEGSEKGLLDAFLLLSHAPDESIAQFARRYGVLSIESFNHPGWWAESLDHWRGIIARAHLTLLVAVAIHDGRPIGEEMWSGLAPWWNEWRRVEPKRRDILRLQDVLDSWIRWAEIRQVIQLERSADGLRPTFLFTNTTGAAGPTLTMRGALALQIVSAATLSGRLVSCSACGRAYATKRRPSANQRNYCDLPDCQREAWRYAKGRERSGVARSRKRATRASRLSSARARGGSNG